MFSPLTTLNTKHRFLNLAILLGAFYALTTFSPAQAQSVDTREIVAESRYTIEKLKADKEFANVTAYIDKARAVLIIPQLIKAGFLIGGRGRHWCSFGQRRGWKLEQSGLLYPCRWQYRPANGGEHLRSCLYFHERVSRFVDSR